jgi:hypothetical protein
MINKKVISGIVAASLFVAVPASAQLLGGGLTGTGAGSLGGSMGRIGAEGALSGTGQGGLGAGDSLAGARSGLSRIGSSARERTASAASDAAAKGKSGAQASKDAVASEKPQPGLLDGTVANAGGGGSLEKEAGGRRVKAHGRSDNQVSRDASGLGLASANDAGASLEKIEPVAAEQPAAEAEQK